MFFSNAFSSVDVPSYAFPRQAAFLHLFFLSLPYKNASRFYDLSKPSPPGKGDRLRWMRTKALRRPKGTVLYYLIKAFGCWLLLPHQSLYPHPSFPSEMPPSPEGKANKEKSRAGASPCPTTENFSFSNSSALRTP